MSTAAEKTTVLIIDNSEAIRMLITVYLRSGGYQVLEATNGQIGLEIAAGKRPDLVILDITMPVMDGFSVCARLQQDDELRDIPVLMLSALSDTESKMRAFELGAVDYITKPVSKGELLARIRTHLTINRLTSSLQQANKELRSHQKQLVEGLHAAANLQKNLLPRRIPDCKTLNFASYFNPCQEIGGDIYNIQRLDDEHVALHIIDVSGHGFSAAMMTALTSQALSYSGTIVTTLTTDGKRAVTPPASVIQELDKEFPLHRFNLYMTLFYILFNTKKGSFRYCCAGHPPGVQIKADGAMHILKTGGPPAGMGGEWEEGSGQMETGDRLFFYTDGLTEYCNRDGEFYSSERLLQSMQNTTGLPLQAAVQNIIGEIKQFGKQADGDDDMTFLAMEKKSNIEEA